MPSFSLRLPSRALLAAALLLAPDGARAHFLWVTVEPPTSPRGVATIRTFLNEEPEPGGPEFLRFVREVKPTVDGRALGVSLGEETTLSTWAGRLPRAVDAARDLGVRTKADATYRLKYTARAQTEASTPLDKEAEAGLRARLIETDGQFRLQVLFDGKPAARARIKAYPAEGEPAELTADDRGLGDVPGLAEGNTGVWANWNEPRAGEVDGKAYTETRHYATLTFKPAGPREPSVATAFAVMPAPAVNSFGGAVAGDWLYVYSGHTGITHEYNVNTTAKIFRRLNLKDRTTWESLPMGPDVQGVALVSDGRFVYRVGGMSARNAVDAEHDLHSVADFARFDLESKTWTELDPMPRARSTHDAAIVGRIIYAVGGWQMKGATEKATFLDNAVAFDLDAPEAGWKVIDQPFRRRALSAASANGKLYVLGGLDDGLKVQRRVDVYEPATKTWTRGPDLPTHAKNDGFGTSSFGIRGRIYFSGVAGRIFRLDPDEADWEPIGAWSLPRITHRILPGPDLTLLAVGGNARGKQIPVIEAIPLQPAAAEPLAGGD